jgi:hypothetical protein
LASLDGFAQGATEKWIEFLDAHESRVDRPLDAPHLAMWICRYFPRTHLTLHSSAPEDVSGAPVPKFGRYPSRSATASTSSMLRAPD